MKKCICNLILVAAAIMIATPQIARADELAELKAQMTAMQKRLEQLEAKQAKQEKAAIAVDQKYVDSLVGNAIEKNKGSIGTLPAWVNNITPFGDFRFRYESLRNTSGDDNDDTLVNDRRRNRIRARLGFKAKINDEWDTIFRIASGSSDTPTSTNQTVDGAFESKDLWLDLAYADWHPADRPGLNITMGKIKNPFYRVGKNQLIWDSDVNPEGGAASYNWDWNSSTAATVTGGAFWLDEREAAADAGYFGIQGMAKHILDGGNHLIGGVSYYNIGNIDNKSVGGVELEGNTQTAADTGAYEYDYDILEFFGEYGFHCGEMPVTAYASFVENTAAPSGRNKGFLVGATLNKAKAVGSWQLSANYRELESDAVFGGLSDSDFIDGGTGGKGWKLGYKYQLAKNIQAGLTYFINDRDRRVGDGSNDTGAGASGGSGSQNFDRLQVDLIFKF